RTRTSRTSTPAAKPPESASRAPVLLHAFGTAEQQHVRTTTREQTVRHDADDTIDTSFQFYRLFDCEPTHVDDHIAVVGQDALAPLRRSAEAGQFARDMATRHW